MASVRDLQTELDLLHGVAAVAAAARFDRAMCGRPASARRSRPGKARMAELLALELAGRRRAIAPLELALRRQKAAPRQKAHGRRARS